MQLQSMDCMYLIQASGIRNADEIHAVWQRFYEWISANVAPDEVMVLVTYNGVGKEDETRDNSDLAVCDCLVTSAGLTANRGWVLYTDN